VFGPSSDLNLQWQLPGSSTFAQLPRLWSCGSEQAAAQQLLARAAVNASSTEQGATSNHRAGRQLSSGEVAAAAAAGSVGLLAAAASAAAVSGLPVMTPPLQARQLPHTVVISSLNLAAAGQLRAAVFGAGSDIQSAYGQVDGWIDLPALLAALPPAAKQGDCAWLRWRVACEGCSVSIDGLTVASAMHNLPGASACMCAPAGAGSAQALALQVGFQTATLHQSSLVVEFDACAASSGSWVGVGSWQSVDGALAARGLVLAAADAAGAGSYREGMLCHTRAGSHSALAFLDAASAAAGSRAPFRYRVSELAPGLEASPDARELPATVTCWAYWSGSMQANASVGAWPLGVGQASMYIGTTAALRSGSSGYAAGAPTSFAAAASGDARLLVLEWAGVAADGELWVASSGDGQGQVDYWAMSGVAVAAAQAAAAGWQPRPAAS